MTCTTCPKRSTCKELCEEAEEYVNQDYVPQTEVVLSSLEYSTIVQLTKSNDELIAELYFNKHKRQYEIAKIIGVSRPYVCKIIKQYRTIIIKNLKKAS